MQNIENEQEEMTANKTEQENTQKLSLKKDNRGIGVVEIVLILVVLIALIIIFKDKIMEVINAAFESITSGASSL
jgi:hypothetical protein